MSTSLPGLPGLVFKAMETLLTGDEKVLDVPKQPYPSKISEHIARGITMKFEYIDEKSAPTVRYHYGGKEYELCWHYGLVNGVLRGDLSRMMKSPVTIPRFYEQMYKSFSGSTSLIDRYARAELYWSKLQQQLWPLSDSCPRDRQVHYFVYAVASKVMIHNERSKLPEDFREEIGKRFLELENLK